MVKIDIDAEYEKLKVYRYEEIPMLGNKKCLYETDKNLLVMSDCELLPITGNIIHTMFMLDEDPINQPYFNRHYVVPSFGFSLTPNLDKSINLIDDKPLYLTREVNDANEWWYHMRMYTPDTFMKNKQALVVGTRPMTDMKRMFAQVKEEFGIDLEIQLEEFDAVRLTKEPFKIEVIRTQRRIYEVRMDEGITDKVLIIKQFADKVEIDATETKRTIIVLYKNKKTGVVSDPKVFKISREMEDILNPLLLDRVTEINDVPVIAKYDDNGMLIEYDKKSTLVDIGEDCVASLYPADLRRNRDWIYNEDLYYLDAYYNTDRIIGCATMFTRFLLRKKEL